MINSTTPQGEYFFLPQEHILFGPGSLDGLADELARLGCERALIITGQTLATQTDVVSRVVQSLGSSYLGTFPGIHQHTPESDVTQAIAVARDLQADVLISAGGGSPIDATKAVVMALFHETGVFLPQIAIPTTLSAAEFSHLVGVTDETLKTKVGFAHTHLTPRCVILDANLTLATPMKLWLSSGIRALDHAVETLYAPGVHPINDILALAAIRKLFEYLPYSKLHPEDLHSRTELQLAAWMSFFGEVNTAMGLSHNLGRRIGASYNVPHGITSCITLPHVMRALSTIYTLPLVSIAQAINKSESTLDPIEAANHAADAVHKLIKALDLPQRLRDVGISQTELSRIAVTIPGHELHAEQIEELLRKMW